jgi:voltage-gated potassium channel
MENQQIVIQFGRIVAVAILLLALGTVFYHEVEEFTWVDSAYFCVATLATVGYGDLAPKTDTGKIFTMVYILFGVGIFAALASALFRQQQERARNRTLRKEALAAERSSVTEPPFSSNG